MEVKITVDYKDAVQGLDEISSKRFMKAWAIAIKNLAKHNVQEKANESNGRSFWQREILPSIHEEVGDAYASIYSDSYIAQHVHDGGVIQQGSHDSLLSDESGKYYELWNAQAQYYTEKTA